MNRVSRTVWSGPAVALAVLALVSTACGADGATGGPQVGADVAGPPISSDSVNFGGTDTAVATPDLGGGADVPGPRADVPVSARDVPVGADVPAPPVDVPGPRPDLPGGPCRFGDVLGVVCSPSGTVFISGALVYVETTDCSGQRFRAETLSDANGQWTLPGVPAGAQQVHIRKGSFQHDFDTEVREGTNDLRGLQGKLCFNASAARIAVLTGTPGDEMTYDRIEEILDGLGVEYDTFLHEIGLFGPTTSAAIDLLMDPDALDEYHILFINCSEYAQQTLGANALQIGINLSTFVQNGGSLYASDWAYPFAERAWPGAIDFYGEPDNVDDTHTKVGMDVSVTASVEDPSLAASLGRTSVRINFDLQAWVVMRSVAANVTTHIRGPAMLMDLASGETYEETLPLMASFRPYPLGGKVLFTSFHNEAQPTDDMKDILNFLVFEL